MMSNRKAIVVSFLCICCTAALAGRFHKQLSTAEREHLLDGSFTIVATTEALPANVKQAFAEITDQQSFALANPGQKYQATDVISERGLPLRRLLFAGVRDDKWFIHYERGGYGHSYCVVVFKVNQEQGFQFLGGGAGFRGAKNFEELRKMVAADQLPDNDAAYW